MYHVLLVDDEVDSLYALQASLDWTALGVEKLFLADSAAKAQQLLECHTVHLVICDIEMPGMDGLQLWSWIRAHFPDTEGIFLTCHADFSYAQQAIALGGRNYLLKPVRPEQLADEIQKVFAAIAERNSTRKSSTLWHESLAMRRRDYLHNVINGIFSPGAETLDRISRAQELDFAPGMEFFPVLLLVQQWQRELAPKDVPLMEYGIGNTARETFIRAEPAGDVLLLGRGHILVLFYLRDGARPPVSVEGTCREQIDLCSRHLLADISCLIGRRCTIGRLASVVEELKEFGRTKAMYHRRVYFLDQPPARQNGMDVPSPDEWPGLLQSGSGGMIYTRLADWLQTAGQNGGVDIELLQRIQQDFLQAVYGVLQENNIQANLLFQDKHSFHMQEQSLYSAEHFLAWVQWILHRAGDCLEKIRNADSVVMRVRKFIAANIKQEDLSREVIANAVFLNPDYLSRLFKQQTGVSLSEYVQQQRLNLAKNLLTQTSLPVGNIALDLGYSSFSYFTRVFKAATGCAPMEYRKRYARREP